MFYPLLLMRWHFSGRPAPPPHAVKQRVVRHYQKRFDLATLVETGTYQGHMVSATKDRFEHVYSIELSAELCAAAVERFRSDAQVSIIQGDSSEVLPQVLRKIRGPSLFWLDGHFSGGNTARGASDYPVLRELRHIQQHPVKNHVILIDDARLFSGEKGIPSQEQVIAALRATSAAYTIVVKDDIIRAYVDR